MGWFFPLLRRSAPPLVAVLLLAFHGQALAQHPESDPYNITPLGNSILFSAYTEYYGRELWRYDPVRDEVHLVKDTNPGPADGMPPEYGIIFPRAGDIVIFPVVLADETLHIWRSDGTPEGTYALKSFARGIVDGLPNFYEHIRPLAFFDLRLRGEVCLYFTDGALKNLFLPLPNCSPGWGLIAPLITIPGTDKVLICRTQLPNTVTTFLYDMKTRSLESNELALPADFRSLSPPIQLTPEIALTICNSDGHDKLAVMSLPDLQVTPIRRDLEGLRELTLLNGKCYFQATDETHGAELWTSDGTPEGTEIVSDIRPGPASGDPWGMCAAGGLIYFSAEGESVGTELYCSDGTTAGTRLVRDLRSGPDGSHPYRIHNLHGRAVFGARHRELGEELWISDGTEAGTHVIKDIWPGPGYGEPYHFEVVDDLLYFSANDGANGRELWRSDGTADGTWMVADINPAPRPLVSSNPSHLLAGDSAVVFTAEGADGAPRLWESDGTTDGTRLLAEQRLPKQTIPIATRDDVVLAVCAPSGQEGQLIRCEDAVVTPVAPGDLRVPWPPQYVQSGGATWLAAARGADAPRLWMIAPPYSTARPLTPEPSHDAPSRPQCLLPAQGSLYFAATAVSGGLVLWRAEGTEAGPLESPVFQSLGELTWFRGQLYCVADDGIHGAELWRIDPATGAGQLLRDICPVQLPGAPAPAQLTPAGDYLFFTARTEAEGVELWATGGTSEATVLVRDIAAGPGSSFPADLTAFDDRLWFAATSAAEGRELWVSDGTSDGTWSVRDSLAGPESGAPAQLTVAGDALVIEVKTQMYLSSVSRELICVFNPRTISTVNEIWPGPPGAEIAELTPFNDIVLFRANDGLHGAELWKCDPEERTAELVKDLLPQPRIMPRRR